MYQRQENKKLTFKMVARSTIKDVIQCAKPHFQVSEMNRGTVLDKCITVQKNNQEIDDWEEPIVQRLLDCPFIISK